jgi:hypothetical protein
VHSRTKWEECTPAKQFPRVVDERCRPISKGHTHLSVGACPSTCPIRAGRVVPEAFFPGHDARRSSQPVLEHQYFQLVADVSCDGPAVIEPPLRQLVQGQITETTDGFHIETSMIGVGARDLNRPREDGMSRDLLSSSAELALTGDQADIDALATEI